MSNELDDAIKHAVMANHDGELKSICILMLVGDNEPEIHMAVSTDQAYEMNGAVDMLKVEMLKLLTMRAEERKPRAGVVEAAPGATGGLALRCDAVRPAGGHVPGRDRVGGEPA